VTLADRFDRHLSRLNLPTGPAVLAVSGGSDSLALLDLVARSSSAGSWDLHVAHADHGIHPESAMVALAVRAAAARYRFPIHVERLNLGPGTSETAARTARYGWFSALLAELDAELLFTAHHQDDQVETILMRYLHGSGPAGLAGIPTRRGRIVRPLLPFRREELAEHVQGIGLTAWEDPANRDPRHERSWIRTELLPAIRRRIPDVDRRILGIGRQAAADRSAWDALPDQLPELDLRQEWDGVSVAASPLHGYDSGVLRALLGALGRRAGCLVGPARATRIERLLAGGRSGAVAELGAGCAAELSFGRLRLFRGVAHPLPWGPRTLEGESGSAAVGIWRLVWRTEIAPEQVERTALSSWFVESSPPYGVRPWLPGDRIRPLGGVGRRLVVRCMQDARIARTQRAAWPVLETGGAIVWVPGVCRSAERIPPPGTLALRIDAHLA